jgi:hypothetical protein
MVIPQHAAEPFPAFNVLCDRRRVRIWLDQPIVQALMVAFGVLMLEVSRHGPA